MAESVNLPLTGFGDSTAEVAVDLTPDGVVELVKLAISADGSAVLIPADLDGLFVQFRLESPQTSAVLAAALSAGANVDLNAADITTGKTGRLLGVDIGGTVPCRCDIQEVNGARTTRTTIYTERGESKAWRPPMGSKWFDLVGGVGKHFGVSITNLDVNKAADLRGTIYWDEIT